jgi:hypothetical protein
MAGCDHASMEAKRRRRLSAAIGAGLPLCCVLALAASSVRCSALFSVEDFAGGAAPLPRDGGAADAAGDADGADVGCVPDGDHTSDPHNCGACDHSCLGGACKAGKCEPVALASGTGCPSGIAVYGDEIYWTEWNDPVNPTLGKVARVLMSTRIVTVMAETTTIPVQIVADDLAVYWSENSTNKAPDSSLMDGHVWKLDKSRIGEPGEAGAAEALRWWDHTIGMLALSSTDIYYAEYHSVNRIPKGGGGIYAEISPKLGLTGGIAVDQTGVYFTDVRDAGIGSVWLYTNGDASVLAAGGGMSPAGVAVDSHNVYWTNFFASGDAGYLVMMADKFFPGDAAVLAQNQQGPLGIAVDGNHVYWANMLDGKIMRIVKMGGPPEVMATGNSPRSVAIDTKAIYWTDCGSGSVMALAR